MPRVEHVAAMNLRRSMIDHSCSSLSCCSPVTTAGSPGLPSPTSSQLERQSTRFRELRYDVVTRNTKQLKFVRPDRRQRNPGLARVAFPSDHHRELRE